MKKKTTNNLLAVRIQPWQLYKFKKYVDYRKSRPSIIIQEALQIYFSTQEIPEKYLEIWLDEFHRENKQ